MTPWVRPLVGAVTAGTVGGVLGAAFVVAFEKNDPNWAVAGLTAVLVLVTSAYVVLTARLVSEARLARHNEQERWTLDRLRQPARAALDVVRRAQDALASPDDGYRQLAGQFASALNEHIPFLDQSIRGRVEFCKEVARVSSFPDTEFGDVGLARLAARHVRDMTRWSLEAYLADKPLPDWTDSQGDPMPEGNNFPWLVNLSRQTGQNT